MSPHPPTTKETIAELLKQDMDRAIDEIRRTLEVEMFRSEPLLFQTIAYPPTPWYRKAYWRVHAYFYTLWRAVKGDELDDPCNCDDY